MIVKLEYSDKFIFESETGRKLVVDENTPKPMELLLIALMGCTGVDVIEILNKMKVQYEKFEIIADGKRSENYPKRYEYIKLIYKFYGKNLNKEKEKIERAVSLSQNKYCSVKASLNANIDYSIEIYET